MREDVLYARQTEKERGGISWVGKEERMYDQKI